MLKAILSLFDFLGFLNSSTLVADSARVRVLQLFFGAYGAGYTQYNTREPVV